jgi:hypothetical protein
LEETIFKPFGDAVAWTAHSRYLAEIVQVSVAIGQSLIENLRS